MNRTVSGVPSTFPMPDKWHCPYSFTPCFIVLPFFSFSNLRPSTPTTEVCVCAGVPIASVQGTHLPAKPNQHKSSIAFLKLCGAHHELNIQQRKSYFENIQDRTFTAELIKISTMHRMQWGVYTLEMCRNELCTTQFS